VLSRHPTAPIFNRTHEARIGKVDSDMTGKEPQETAGEGHQNAATSEALPNQPERSEAQ
jgi:hypothetical protein